MAGVTAIDESLTVFALLETINQVRRELATERAISATMCTALIRSEAERELLEGRIHEYGRRAQPHTPNWKRGELLAFVLDEEAL